MYGQAGEDVIFGGSGDDELRGDTGIDMLWGGSGLDEIYFEVFDAWLDFMPAKDWLAVVGSVYTVQGESPGNGLLVKR